MKPDQLTQDLATIGRNGIDEILRLKRREEELQAALTESVERGAEQRSRAEQAEAEVEALREANDAFGRRQEWWTERMFTLEQECDALRAYAEQAVLAEREECAKVCDSRVVGDHNREDAEAARCAAAIRGRK